MPTVIFSRKNMLMQDKIVAGTEGWTITELEELRVLLIRQAQLPAVRCLFCCDHSHCQRACRSNGTFVGKMSHSN